MNQNPPLTHESRLTLRDASTHPLVVTTSKSTPKTKRAAGEPASPAGNPAASHYADGTDALAFVATCAFGHPVARTHARKGHPHLSWGETLWVRFYARRVAKLVGKFSDGRLSRRDALIVGGVNAHVGKEARMRIRTYTPDISAESWAHIGPFVRDVVATTAPRTAYTAQRLLTPVTRFVFWCVNNEGLPLNARVLFRRITIGDYIDANVDNLSEGSQRNYRAMMLRISEILIPEDNQHPMVPLNNKTVEAPYTDEDLARLTFWANGQRTPLRLQKSRTMLCLGAGAGLTAGEISLLFRRDITIDADGILITVPGPRGRQVPLLSRWEKLLIVALTGIPDDAYVFGGKKNKPLKNALSTHAKQSNGVFVPRSDRLRATWLVTQLAAATPMKALMTAAGLQKFENLSAYLDFLPTLDTPEYRKALRIEANS
jgi:integrase